ncbi:MAG: PAC2 family protein [Ignisphaera sp.]|uniref:Proteasome assembly chaperone family protein n=1 Tax=Ignisphaera aggregans TaxID=334771 RepID=A0A7C4JK08_9CREN
MWFYKKLNEIPGDVKHLMAISGFPGMGFVGKTVADYLRNYLNATPVGRIYGYGFPAHLLSYEYGVADVMNVEISFAKRNGLGILIITSEIQPISDQGQHSLSRYLAQKLTMLKVKELIAAAAYVSDIASHARKVYVVGTDTHIISRYAEKGAIPLNGGIISGLNGVIIGWAKFYGLNAVCLLGETWRSIAEMNYVDYIAAKIIIDLLDKVWNLGVDTSELDKQGLSVETQVKSIIDQYMHSGKSMGTQEVRPYYIT